MKILYIILLSVIVAAARNSPLTEPQKKDRYFVMAPHSPEHCRNAMIDMKESDRILLSNFDFGCNYNDHTFYGVAEGASNEDVRGSLPSALRSNAKIKKVDKLSADEIEKMHSGEKGLKN